MEPYIYFDFEKSDYKRIRNGKLELVHDSRIKHEPVPDFSGKSDADIRVLSRERGLKVPPAWVDLWLNENRSAPLQLRGKDSKGRLNRLYLASAMEENAVAKFNRLKEFTKDFPSILKKIEQDIDTKDEAKILYIIAKTGMRVGSERDRKAKVQAYGVSTLASEHVSVSGEVVTFNFIGKEGVKQNHSIKDKKIAELVSGKEGKLFSTSEDKVLNYLKKLTGKDYLVKDFRTYVGTYTALKAIKKLPKPTSEKEKASFIKQVCIKVSEVLGNTPIMAKESYIAPECWDLLEIA
jgi:DNA topoisomerase I